MKPGVVVCAVVWVCLSATQAAARSPLDRDRVLSPIRGIQFLESGPDTVTLGVGAFNVIANDDIANDDPSGEARIEYRVGGRWNAIGPMVGVLANTDGGVFGYAALYADMRLGERWVLTPAAGVGAYEDGEGKDLGGVFQFHLGLDVAYRFEDDSRLGLKLAHISNAFLHDENPGSESLLLTYTIPLGDFGLSGP